MQKTRTDYPAPVVELMALGRPSNTGKWLDYSTISIDVDHITELNARMMNFDYHFSQDERAMWIPLHAWRALAQLRCLDMVLGFSDLLVEMPEDEWLHDDVPRVVQELGPRAVPAWIEALDKCQAYENESACNAIVEGLWPIGKRYPEARRPLINAFTQRLANYRTNSEGYNGFLVVALEELRATNAIPIIAAAYADEAVDELCEYWDGVVQTFNLPAGSSPQDFIEKSA